MLKRSLAFAAIVCVALGVVAGCDSTGEQQRSVVSVASLNCSAPGFCDVADSTGAIWETWIPVFLYNRPYNGLVITDPESPHGEFVVTEYRIDWASVGGGPILPSRTEYTSVGIPTGEVVGATIRLVSLAEVASPTLFPLVTSGQLSMVANITFIGHEIGTERETEVKASINVSFANFVDEEQDDCTL